MSIGAMMAQELEHEAASTRKHLERVPDAKLGWKPHEKSMSLGALASHLAELPQWTKVTCELDVFEFSTKDYKPWVGTSSLAMRAKYDECLLVALEALRACPDARMQAPWTMKMDGHTLFTMPRVAVLRTMILNHQIHHRAQLGLYLRLNDVAVPKVYGPSADEQ